MLKRCLGSLIEELERKDERRIQARLKYMSEVLLPRCYVWVASAIKGFWGFAGD